MFLAPPLPAQKPWARISVGAAQAAGIKETLEAPAEFQPYVALGDQRAFGWGEAITMEFGVFITPRFSLSLGTGYFRHKLDGQKSPFPTKEYMDSEGETGREDFYTVVPGIELEIMPFFLNASYRIAVFEEFKDCQVSDSHFPIGDPDGDLFPEFAYTIEEISITGISLQAGIKLLF